MRTTVPAFLVGAGIVVLLVGCASAGSPPSTPSGKDPLFDDGPTSWTISVVDPQVDLSGCWSDKSVDKTTKGTNGQGPFQQAVLKPGATQDDVSRIQSCLLGLDSTLNISTFAPPTPH